MAHTIPRGLRWRSSTGFVLFVVAFSQFCDVLVYCMVLPVLPFLLHDRLHIPIDETQKPASIVLATFSLASLVFAVPAGLLVDYSTTRRRPFLFSLVALFAATSLFAVADDLFLLVLSRMLQGLSATIVYAAGLTMVVDAVGSERLGTALGSIHSLVAVAELGSPPLGGLLYSTTGFKGMFGISLATIAVDFGLRFLVIETPVAAEYIDVIEADVEIERDHASEQERLLPTEQSTSDVRTTAIDEKVGNSYMPVLRLCQNPRLATALFFMFVQALIFGSLDATLALELSDEFGFSASGAGAMFLFAGLPSLVTAPVCGYLVDIIGVRIVSTIAFTLFTPALIAFRLPLALYSLDQTPRVVIFSIVLAFNGIGLSAIGTAGMVEAQKVVEEQLGVQTETGGRTGPYGQLFGLTGLVSSAGLSVGVIVCGLLRSRVGYGNMNAALAVLTAICAVAAFMFVGNRDLQRRLPRQHADSGAIE